MNRIDMVYYLLIAVVAEANKTVRVETVVNELVCALNKAI